MFYPGEVKKFRITPENIEMFKYDDPRTENVDYINDRKVIGKKMVDYEKGVIDDLTKVYPERYDLTVLTYDQYKEPYFIIDGCHRIEALKKDIFPEKLIDGFTFWLIPSNVWCPESKDEAFRLNKMVNDELKKNSLPLWVKKFDFAEYKGKLTAWKNINIIDTGDISQPLQFRVDWILNENPFIAEDKELNSLPKWKDLVK